MFSVYSIEFSWCFYSLSSNPSDDQYHYGHFRNDFGNWSNFGVQWFTWTIEVSAHLEKISSDDLSWWAPPRKCWERESVRLPDGFQVAISSWWGPGAINVGLWLLMKNVTQIVLLGTEHWYIFTFCWLGGFDMMKKCIIDRINEEYDVFNVFNINDIIVDID